MGLAFGGAALAGGAVVAAGVISGEPSESSVAAAEGAIDGVIDTVGDGFEDAGDWLLEAGEDAGDFIMDLF
jgi:hypothetical protein